MNSYLTREEAERVADGVVDDIKTAWDRATPAERKRAKEEARRFLDSHYEWLDSDD